jgi:rod shape-determining protein MreD
MKQRILAGALLLYAITFLQGSIIGAFEIVSVHAVLPICMTVVVALLRSPAESAIMGFLFGLSMDFLIGRALGWYALLFMGVATLIAMVSDKLYRERLVIRMVFTFFATMVIEICYALGLFLLRGYDHLPWMIGVIILPEAIMNSLLVMPLLHPVKQLYHTLDTSDRARNRI